MISGQSQINTPNFVINEKSQDSLLINVLNNLDIIEEIPMMVDKNDLSIEEIESAIHSISCKHTHSNFFFENCNDSQDGNSVNKSKKKNAEIADVASKLTLIITDPIDRIKNFLKIFKILFLYLC